MLLLERFASLRWMRAPRKRGVFSQRSLDTTLTRSFLLMAPKWSSNALEEAGSQALCGPEIKASSWCLPTEARHLKGLPAVDTVHSLEKIRIGYFCKERALSPRQTIGSFFLSIWKATMNDCMSPVTGPPNTLSRAMAAGWLLSSDFMFTCFRWFQQAMSCI